MAKCDPNIYGADETATAASVANAALANPKPEMWSGRPGGAPMSKGGGGDEKVSSGEVVTKTGISPDSRNSKGN